MRRLVILLVLVACVGCGATKAKLSVNALYVAGDRATYDVLGVAILTLCDDDPANNVQFTSLKRNAIRELINTWRMRLEAAERQLREVD